MRSFFLTLIFILSFLNVSCDPQTSISPENKSVPTVLKQEQSIVYLFFEIEKKSNGDETVKHTDTKITSGTMKEGSIDHKENIPGNITVNFLGKNGEKIWTRIIEDPLNPTMETYSEEGLHREKMTLPKAEFSIRFNQTGNISAVQLDKITPNSKTHLITVQL